jgi:hypothetical protein
MTLDPGRVQAVFLAALEQETPADRGAVLDRECAADAELRRRVEALLVAHDQPDSLLDRPLIVHLEQRPDLADGVKAPPGDPEHMP